MPGIALRRCQICRSSLNRRSRAGRPSQNPPLRIATERAHKLLVSLIVMANLPIRIVESRQFKTLLKFLAPWYRVPCRATIGKVIDKLYSKGVTLLADKIKDQSVCLTMDLATVLHSTRHFLVVTLHFIDDSSNNLMSVSLAVKQLMARSTAPELINIIRLILREFGLKKNQIKSTCSDRGANIKKACTDLFGANKTVFCICHLLDNAVQTSLSEVRPLMSFLNDVKSVVAFIKRSTTAANLLRKYQLADGRMYSMCLMPIQSVATRWNSVLHCTKRYILLHPYINKVLQDSSLSSSNPPPVILQECIKTLDEIIKVLEPVENCTLTFSSSKNWTGSLAVIAFKSLAHTIKNTNVTEPVAKKFKDALLKNLGNLNAHVEDNILLGAANVLDPRFKGASLTKEQYAKAIGLIKVDVEQAKERGNNGADSENLPFLDDSCEDILMSYFQAKSPLPKRARTQDEINEYLNSPLEPYQCSPNEWWDLHESDFPRLSVISKSFLKIPPSSVASERVVSSINLVLKAEKSRMLSQRLARLIFLRNLPETFWQGLIS
ncbi:E3 SUMO-protein ligase ZBED1-like [Cloeon dipterum]|uniref:E3 SUMO-protein ligase ZBED1-like n=1 Tax=Cloeon dipterum TaxID=197152 RepID=UPI00321FF8F2